MSAWSSTFGETVWKSWASCNICQATNSMLCTITALLPRLKLQEIRISTVSTYIKGSFTCFKFMSPHVSNNFLLCLTDLQWIYSMMLDYDIVLYCTQVLHDKGCFSLVISKCRALAVAPCPARLAPAPFLHLVLIPRRRKTTGAICFTGFEAWLFWALPWLGSSRTYSWRTCHFLQVDRQNSEPFDTLWPTKPLPSVGQVPFSSCFSCGGEACKPEGCYWRHSTTRLLI